MSAIRHLWHNHRLVFIAFCLASLVTLAFLLRLAVFSIYWSDPARRNLAPEAWMTPGYIAHSWGLAPERLSSALAIPPGTRPTLRDIARARGVGIEVVIGEVEAVLAETGGRGR